MVNMAALGVKHYIAKVCGHVSITHMHVFVEDGPTFATITTSIDL